MWTGREVEDHFAVSFNNPEVVLERPRRLLSAECSKHPISQNFRHPDIVRKLDWMTQNLGTERGGLNYIQVSIRDRARKDSEADGSSSWPMPGPLPSVCVVPHELCDVRSH